jgi:hypothetical protein
VSTPNRLMSQRPRGIVAAATRTFRAGVILKVSRIFFPLSSFFHPFVLSFPSAKFFSERVFALDSVHEGCVDVSIYTTYDCVVSATLQLLMEYR